MPDLLDSTDPGRRDRQLIATAPALKTIDVPEPALAEHPVLSFTRVTKWYGPVIGANQVTLELRPGITGLVGANGAGKSTLLRLAAGQLRPDLGRVEVMGHDAWSSQARLYSGYCPEVDAFYEEMSGRQFVLTMAKLCGYSRSDSQDRTERVLNLVGMADRSMRRLRGYSKGMRQRIKLAQALLHDPPLLILDEPLSGIDPVGRQETVELFLNLAGQGKCLLISSHELDELEKLTDHVAIMARGRIAAVGTVSSIRDRLDDHPLSIRIELDRVESWSGHSDRAAELFHVEHSASPARSAHRDLAVRLLALPMVVSVEVLDEDPENERGRLIVRARQPRVFFEALGRLVLEEWYEVREVLPLDDSTAAVLGYLLGGGVIAT
jgi:ABC-2 type transport system ATP-binding protein